ncbi:alpha/beta hydrolase [Homoserinibacter sp. GY 40078]|uniref:alpha/beta hydrolase n=1 Tax=Homoserinibacter sp. GY 40078 TaxID=2603275 RepID=UPI0011CC58F0|nr:alpha/beta hydrolase [Homoserinibacter sp. GY 40078]TXK19316.1 alpha/beta hydrolase [Homoserinibacter sp. GY 40078]
MSNTSPDVVFIHGLWVHASSWQPWQDLFATKGYTSIAPGWPGDKDTVAATREEPSGMDGVGIAQIFDHYADIIRGLDTKPIAIGHSFGGLIAQELLAHDLVRGAAAIDPAPIKGVTALPFSQLKSGLPVLKNPANKKRTVALTAKEFHYSFGNKIDEAECNAIFESVMIPGPGRPLFEDATAAFTRNSPAAVDTHHAVRGPLLLGAGTEDHVVPLVVTKQVAKLYADNPSSVTDLHEYPGKGHSLTLDSGWRDVADDVLAWLEEKALTPTPATA